MEVLRFTFVLKFAEYQRIHFPAELSNHDQVSLYDLPVDNADEFFLGCITRKIFSGEQAFVYDHRGDRTSFDCTVLMRKRILSTLLSQILA